MIHPNRTYLLELKEKRRAAHASHEILTARRQALILEFISTARAFVTSRRNIRALVDQAVISLELSIALENPMIVDAIAQAVPIQEGTQIRQINVFGILCREAFSEESFTRPIAARHYDLRNSSPQLEKATGLFERIVDAVLPLANQEERLRRIGAAVKSVTRKVRILEERILPHLDKDIKTTAARISEREREEYFRRKRFKKLLRIRNSNQNISADLQAGPSPVP
jgi:V/A-type H+-transporting ATPase subunit D